MAKVDNQAPIGDEVAEVPKRVLAKYSRLWQLETWLRRMVYVELRALLGDGWSDGLPTSSASMAADKRLTHMPTPEMNALSYAQLSKLQDLITRHWDCFAQYLPPPDIWTAKLAEVSQIRHRVAHFRIGHVDDLQRVLQLLRDVDDGFWRFCTSYNDAQPVIPATDDPSRLSVPTPRSVPLDRSARKGMDAYRRRESITSYRCDSGSTAPALGRAVASVRWQSRVRL
jgi:hypothetical protein